jgi:predicted nucleic acid-binding protein
MEIYSEVNQIDPKDIDYVALAYKLNCPLWTNDKNLKKLNSIKVFSTEDLLKIYNITK